METSVCQTHHLETLARSEDCSSFAHRKHANFSRINHHRPRETEEEGGGGGGDIGAGTGTGTETGGGYVVFNVSAYTRKDLRELKKKLVGELETVRSLASWIESRDFGFPSSSAVVSRQLPPLDSARSDGPKQRKENRKIGGSGRKRPPPSLVSPRDSKRQVVVPPGKDPELEKILSEMIKKCSQILTKLMKHDYGWVFNRPVDVDGQNLHDYHQIIKCPMDLGTVRLRLRKKFYLSPTDYADDVRLTFNNALLYNPKGHDVHVMAEMLLQMFENLYAPKYDEFVKQQRAVLKQRDMPLPPASPVSAPVKSSSTPRPPPPPPQKLQQVPPPPVAVGKMALGKLPKPRAKDPNKREMDLEEKQKLGAGLVNLPGEKMIQVLQIIKKKNPGLSMQVDGEDFELDFESLSTETLWELDRFVCNCKKNMSRARKQEAAAVSAAAAPISVSDHPTTNDEDKVLMTMGETHESTATKKNRRMGGGGEQGEEDVDIGDEELPSGSFPPVEIEKDTPGAGYESSSSESSSDSSSSSSSSGSDSRSSSDSESDADDAPQSPVAGLRPPSQPPRS